MRSLETLLVAGLVLGSSWSGAEANDDLPPAVAITSPAEGASMEGVVSLHADATDDTQVARVEFFVNGTLLASDAAAPFSADWDSGQEANGSYTLTARAYDAEDNGAPSAPVTVSVNQPGRAMFNPVLHAPTCATLDAVCDSMNLLEGRGVGERNASNTLDGCPDGTGANPSYSPMIRRIQLSRVDGEHFAEGRRVRIDVHVVSYSNDLELYYTSDATNPSWTYLTTLEPRGWGAESLSTEYLLPVGGLQAVRARLRDGGDAGACRGSGSYLRDDQDDVVFAVGPPTDTLPPVVALTSPANDTLVGGLVSVTAAADDDMAVERVEFSVDGVLIATDTSAPHEVVWNSASVASGAHTLTAKAYDAGGRVGVSERVVHTDITPPSVALSSPSNNNAVRGTVSIEAIASDNWRVARVDFYEGTNLLGSRSTLPYATTWYSTLASEGYHTLTAKAYDTLGNVTTSSEVRVFVDNTAPTTTLSAPANAGGTVELSATASDNLAVLFVEFYVGATMIARDTTPPYAVSWDTTGLPDGLRTVRAKATDSARNVSEVDRSVKVDNTPPTAQIIAPANGASVFLTTPFNANAGDNTGISKVEFYDGGKLVGTDTTASYGMTWTLLGVSKGWHTLTVKAYDLAGNPTTSAPITVKVN